MTKWNKSEAWQLLICSNAVIIHLDASSVIEVLHFQGGSNYIPKEDKNALIFSPSMIPDVC